MRCGLVGSEMCIRDRPPPDQNNVARPTTEGACHVLLQESMLFDPIDVRMNFWAA